MNTFSKTKRLLNKETYDHVFNHSSKLVTPGFIVLYCTNSLGHARLGLAISKKVVAQAHDRNRLKRLLRETFRISSLELKAIDIVVLARRGVNSEANLTIIDHLNKARGQLSK